MILLALYLVYAKILLLGSMLIDFSTVHSLELIQNFTNPKSMDSLFGLLNNTNTAMGAEPPTIRILN